MIAIAARLASSIGRRDDAPNVELADEIVASKNTAAIYELSLVLESGKSAQQNDAIKVLYEIGGQNPAMIVGQLPAFLTAMQAKNNRLVWGAVTAIASIAQVTPKEIYRHLNEILAAADAGSVIAKDQAMQTLINLASDRSYNAKVKPLIFARLEQSAINQLPMYAERIAAILTEKEIPAFAKILNNRLNEEMPDSKRNRLLKILKRLKLNS